jgi:quinoprotein glucose dehydrogenase
MQPNRRDFVKGLAGAAMAPGGQSTGWHYYGGDQAATHYSPLKQIDRGNVSRLKVAWVHHSAARDSRYRGSVECTPLVVAGVIYIIGADLVVEASTQPPANCCGPIPQ